MSTRKTILIVLALLYAAGATFSAVKVIAETEVSTHDIEQTLMLYSMKNAAAQTLQQFDKQHPVLGFFISSPAEHEMKLPTEQQANHAIYDDVPHLLKMVRKTSSVAAWWSWFLLCSSFLYGAVVIALERSFNTPAVLFALTCMTVAFFAIGVLAPAMVIWTAPHLTLATGELSFVLQHQVRGIAAIIRELFTSGHLVIAAFLLLFSIVTPLTKAGLTFFVTLSQNKKLNYKIGEVLHAIGKWSMADVFVAGVILSLYALKAQEATKSIPCLGLYYFIGYCLMSMTNTELLTHSGMVAEREGKREKKLGMGMIGAVFAAFALFTAGSGAYTYQQYTENLKEPVPERASPRQLNNADLVLPAHK